MTATVVEHDPPRIAAFAAPSPPGSSLSRDEIIDQLAQRLRQLPEPLREKVKAIGVLLDWLEAFPGDDWQTRWENAGADGAGLAWGPVASRRLVARGVTPIIALDVVRPAPSWLARAAPGHLFVTYRRLHEPDLFERLAGAIADEEATRTSGMIALNTLTRVRLHSGIGLLDVEPATFTLIVDAYRDAGRRLVSVELAWRALQAVGGLFDAPATRRAAAHRGPADAAGLVDRYGIECRPVRDLLVAYLREREPSVDHSTLNQLAVSLASRFWRDLEVHHPGIDDLRLEPEVAAAWKDRVRYSADGELRRGSPTILMAVRSFYLDIAQWSLGDPGRWSRWAAPAPVTAADTAGAKKLHRRQQAVMRQRTRTLAPLLPALIDTAERRHRNAIALHVAAQASPIGQPFDVAGVTYVRIARSSHYRDGDRRPAVRRVDDALIVQTFQHEDETFWAWAIVEVLRQTGIRIEELLELTHLSIRRYTQPDGETVALLQVSPSKTDAERVLPVPPELASVLARIITRVSNPDGVVPLVARYDGPERRWLPPQPHLFQRRYGGKPAVPNPTVVRNLLFALADAANLSDVDGRPLRFTPHDFRRIFATEAVNGGLPVHIAQQLLGHLDLNTTSGYLAVYPQQVIDHYRAFIDRRRQRRPDDEYRTATADEWAEFEQHFTLRRVALGTCHRPYGTPCVHEHACIRCPMLRVDPARRPRLEELRHNLTERLDEARRMRWYGEIDGIEQSLTHVHLKLQRVDRAAATPTTLVPPSLPVPSGTEATT